MIEGVRVSVNMVSMGDRKENGQKEEDSTKECGVSG